MTRIAIVQKEKCFSEKCGNYLCERLCPVNRTGSDCIVKGLSHKAVINEGLCTGCGICQNRCPFDAISIINLPEALNTTPIHRYGRNGFHLYNLPAPIFGKVVGILGVNGIGKSTAIKIIAGLIKPNLGKDDNEAGYKDLIEFFKGTESQIFFEKLNKGEIKISYKPQQVDLIPKTQKGLVRELLTKVDEKNQMIEIAKELDIENILDNDITKISGGEMQRVAIAATVLKNANLYIFDEPSSYLDIKQRLKISRFLKKLADENTAVLVVEHDLIILDYMTDIIHMMYGKEGAFGVVSQPKQTKNGINTYLSGYLRDENVRFRDHHIKFVAKQPFRITKKEKLTGWSNITKKLGKFELYAKEGEITTHKVIGILGENGIGKTSFVKILAGVEEPDTGEIDTKIRVSYKPQYLESDSDKIVLEFLKEAIQKYDTALIKPLNIKPLFTKQLNQLSGGELQRVAIANCLSKDADLYLLDEPSAYLDVEQRLIISQTIQNFMELRGTSALLVDHDLLFVDYISQGLIVFDGIPAIKGEVKGPYSMEEGMNIFLTDINLTFRRDEETHRPRTNKEDSQMDRKQKNENKRYYTN